MNSHIKHDSVGYSKLNKWNNLKQTSITLKIQKTLYLIESKKKKTISLGFTGVPTINIQ